MSRQLHAAQRLRALLDESGLRIMPCCHDALSAKLIQQSGFPLTFMSGFGVSASRLGMPDTGLISYGEMIQQGADVCAAADIPVIGDGDTGYGNAVNVQRTVAGYARAGFAGIMLEDQRAPKRCGHTGGKAVVSRHEALARIRAAIEVRDDLQSDGGDIVIMARTDARAEHGLDEAIERARIFRQLGADILFVEAPHSAEELRTVARELEGPLLVNMIAQGKTPVLPPSELEQMGYRIAAYPLTLLSAALYAMRDALVSLRGGAEPEHTLDFEELKRIVGFDDYDRALNRLEGE